MDSLPAVSPSFVLPSPNPLRQRRRRRRLPFSPHPANHRVQPLSSLFGLPRSPELPIRRRLTVVSCAAGGGSYEIADGSDEVQRALNMDSDIPGTSGAFVKRVSSRAYDMRRNLHQTFDSSSYDVLEANPWRDVSKAVYVLTHNENQLCTMKTRQNRSEVERELGLLFSKGGKLRSKATSARTSSKFQMLVEDVREGVLVFEDEEEAANYCNLLQGRGPGCEGVAEIEASSVFDLCQKMRALAVLFRRGRTPPLPESLQLNLKARKRSLEDQDGLI